MHYLGARATRAFAMRMAFRQHVRTQFARVLSHARDEAGLNLFG
jgi:hypothetical protein